MISVLHLTTSLGLAGAEMSLARLVCHMDRSRFRNTVVSMTDAEILPSQLESAGVRFYSLGMSKGMPDPSAAVRLLRTVREVRPQVLQTWMYHADLLGLLVGKWARVPAIVWNVQCSSIAAPRNRWLSKLVLRSLAALSPYPDVVLTNSRAGQKYHETIGYKPREWQWFPNPLDLDQFRPDPEARASLRAELGLPPDARLIGLIARFHPMKDHANFIAAAKMLADLGADLHFVLAGYYIDRDNATLREAIEATGISERFHLLGLRQDLSRIDAALDIACSASAYGEGASNAVGEAMACGVPCVVTDVGDSAFLVAQTGKAVPPRDSEAFALACRSILNLPTEERLQLGMEARKRIAGLCDLPSVVTRYENLYERLALASRKYESRAVPATLQQ